MGYYTILVFFLTAHITSSSANCSADIVCNNNETGSHFVTEFCSENNGTMLGRCCTSISIPHNLIGLDLVNCNLTDFNITDVEPEEIEILDLRNNTLSYFQDKELTSYINLNAIYLPMELGCPGGGDAWNQSEKVFQDFTNFTECQEQLNPCEYLNVSCTLNGHCVHMGPGLAKCLCNDQQYGYRCLQRGEFPAVPFSISITVATIGLSAFLWMYLRKNVISLEETE